MSTYNKVILVGHLGGDPAIRTLENSVKVADFSIATNEVFQKNGESRDSIDWHEIVAWRRLADFSENYLKKGSKVMIEGKLKSSTWLDKENGSKHKSIFILADQIRFMDKKESKASAGDSERSQNSKKEFSSNGINMMSDSFEADSFDEDSIDETEMDDDASSFDTGFNEKPRLSTTTSEMKKRGKKSIQNDDKGLKQEVVNGIMGGFSEFQNNKSNDQGLSVKNSWERHGGGKESTAKNNSKFPF